MKDTLFIIFFSLFLSFAHNGQSQHNYDYIWPLGYDYNPFDQNNEVEGWVQNFILDFKNSEKSFHLDSFYLNFSGTHGSLASRDGKELKYLSNGCQIRDGNGYLLINGDSINFDTDGFWQDECNIEGATNTYIFWNHGVMLPDLTNENKAAFFHVKRLRDKVWASEFRVSHIDSNRVTVKNKILIEDTLFGGWLASVKTADTLGWWILMHESGENTIHKAKYLPTQDTIMMSKQSIGLPSEDRYEITGEAFFSYDGTKYYTLDRGNHLQIYDFDRASGDLSNHRHIHFDVDSLYTVGMVLSPNQRFLYISAFFNIYQVDLMSQNIEESIQVVARHSGNRTGLLGFLNYTLMQLGPDCRIYIAANGGSDRMHVINYPDREGTACEVVEDAIIFPVDYDSPRGIQDSFIVLNDYTLPNFPNFRLDTDEPVCDYDIRTPLTNSEEVILDTGMRILLWPNPVSDVLQIDIGNIQNFSGQFVLRNALGQIQKQIDIHSDQRRYQLPVYDLQPGMYFYEISSAGQSVKSGRVVVK